ncbi:hypothetical protein WQ54_03075 [Bacillus sp. SA1-12]|uniref:NAD(P)-dependent oxidoreductase n=1 Tax=Bacillus sp. SA1-12 TaxID=1455638 RepID=UPI000625AB86|nr:NAD(P)-dependent oxidoreductase [Bacillus sp. SA1-12]KKI93608.1 hypothetical protein WQ54_03075 [Bacillus sp. SA1-12]
MLNHVIVYGIHSYVGFALCERFINEGIEVVGIYSTPTNPISKNLLHERFMMVGRNALFNKIEGYEGTEAEKSADMIIHCCDDVGEASSVEKDRKQLVISVDLAKKLKKPFVFITYKNKSHDRLRKEHIEFCEQYLSSHLDHYTIFHLPVLFGPFQPITEEIHQFLMKDQREVVLNINEPILFIEDAVDTIWELLGLSEQRKIYALQGEMKQERVSLASMEIQLNPGNSWNEGDDIYLIKNPISVEKGLKAQLEFIKKYREILSP